MNGKKIQNEFLRIIAHEFQTPLTVVNSAISLALSGTEGKLSPLLSEDLQEAKTANDRLMKLISNIIVVDNLESGTFGFSPVVTDIESILNSLIDLYAKRAEIKGVKIIFKDKDLPKVSANENAINEVLKQLLENAVNHAQKEIKIYTNYKNKRFWINIADDGSGIDSDNINRLFKKFSHTSYEYTMRNNGLGLGLYIVKKIMNKFGGKIEVESKPNYGARFSVSFNTTFDRTTG